MVETTGTGARHLREHEQSDSGPVNSTESAVTKSNTDGSTCKLHQYGYCVWNIDGRTCNAHRCRYRQLVLREDENGDRSAKFHGGSTRGRVVSDLVAHNCGRVSTETKRIQQHDNDKQSKGTNKDLGEHGKQDER